MATIKKIKMFNENGKPTPEGQIIISDGAYLADMAYKNEVELNNLSKPLNKDFPEEPLKSKMATPSSKTQKLTQNLK